MKLFADVTLKMIELNSFSDENGKTVDYYTNYLKNPEGNALVINSKESFEKFEGKTGVAGIEVREDNEKANRFKLSLKTFIASEGGEPEKEIE